MILLTGMFGYVLGTVLVMFAGAVPLTVYACITTLLLHRHSLRLGAALLLGTVLADLRSASALADALDRRVPVTSRGATLVTQARVEGLVTERASLWSPDETCQQLSVKEMAQPFRRLQVSHCNAQLPEVLPGDLLQLDLVLRPVFGRVNSHGGDSERWALANGIDGYAYAESIQRLERPRLSVDRWRQRLVARIRQQLPDDSWGAAILPALVAGDRSTVSEKQWHTLRGLGLAHLVAISGLHVGLVAGWAWVISAYLLAVLLPRISVTAAARRWAIWPALAAALAYGALAGFSLPTQRALLMLMVVLPSVCGFWRVRPPSALLFALALILAWQPLAVLSEGLWLSFAAVGVILLMHWSGSRSIYAIQWYLCWLGGIAGGVLFGAFQPAAVIANLVLVPLFSLIVIPLALFSVLSPLLSPLLTVCAVLLEGCGVLLGWLSESPALPSAPGITAMALALMAVMRWGLISLPGPRWVWLVLLLPWLFPARAALETGEFDLLTFDVGQGQMQVLRTKSHLLVYDTGPAQQQGSAVEDILELWLAAQTQSPAIVLHSHGDDDHTGGQAAIRKAFPAALFLSGQPDRTSGHLPCYRGQRWHWDGVSIEVLWPLPDLPLRYSNNHSCVLSVRSAAGSVLMAGDLERPVEYWLAPTLAPVDLLLVPHHGSGTSSSFTLLRKITPVLASVSAGAGNRFNHPSENTRSRYHQLGVALYNTAETGMQEFSFRRDRPAEVKIWRERSSWPWRVAAPVIE